MQVLEKILQEIEEEIKNLKSDRRLEVSEGRRIELQERVIEAEKISKIIRSHTEDDGWIPVESGNLPEEGQKVWVTLKYGNGFSEIRGSIFKEGDFWESKYVVYINVIAWMPRFIPMPYQPKEEKR